MKRSTLTFLATILFFVAGCQLFAQGISRSTGLGFRLGYWSMHSAEGGFNVTTSASKQSVNINGLGFWMYFYSRVYENWFMELNLGGVGRVNAEATGFANENADIEAVVPFLFGVRYDLLSARFPSRLLPYLSAGGGWYWRSSATIRNDEITGEEITSTQGDVNLGAYLGAGINFPLVSWFGLNFEFKYHFVDFSPARGVSGPEVGIGIQFMWGKKREIFRVRDTKVIVRDIYPAYYQFYNTYPIALVTVQNTAGVPIEVNVSSRVIPFSVRPKESGFIKIERGEIKDIPATAVFGPEINKISSREPAVLEIKVEGRAGGTHKKEINAQLTVHTRNSWNGEIDKLGFFVTPDDEKILHFSRRLAKAVTDSVSPVVGNLTVAEAVFNELARLNIRYQADPNIPFYKDDRVQYARETLEIRSGDCDDLVVAYASLLESLGINTAFVQVQDPEKPLAHLYLMFDSGLAANEGHRISSNEKRYILRGKYKSNSYFGEDQTKSGSSENNSIWIPVETTLVTRNFEEAWKAGATQFLQEAGVRNGLAEGWVQIIDVN